MPEARELLISVLEMPAFAQAAEGLFTEEERQQLAVFLSNSPEAGDLIKGTGGVRKLRWGAKGKGKGKRGGARVVYYHHGDEVPIFLFYCYGKGSKADLSAKERAELKKIVKAIAESYKARSAEHG